MAKSPKIFSSLLTNFLYKPLHGVPTKGHSFFSASSSSATSGEAEVLGSRSWDYQEYRRSLYGDITHKALLVDAIGTLLVPFQLMAQICKEIGEKYGVEYSEDKILNRYR